jgi:transcriptional regulator with XRE-family HTH domain
MRNTDSADHLRRFLRAERKRRGWTQADLARRANVAKNTVAALEKGMALREGNEGAIEEALELPLGTIEDVRRRRYSPGPTPEPDEPPEPEQLSEPRPEDYPDEHEYMNAVYWYLRRGMGMSHEAVMRGFNMAAAIYERKNTQRSAPKAPSNKVG